MTKLKIVDDAELLATTIIEGVQDAKGQGIVQLDMRDIPHAVADFFVICHGNSNTQVDAISRNVEHNAFEKLEEKAWQKEGINNAEWILLDYGNVVVHIFYKEAREFYGLEELWADARLLILKRIN